MMPTADDLRAHEAHAGHPDPLTGRCGMPGCGWSMTTPEPCPCGNVLCEGTHVAPPERRFPIQAGPRSLRWRAGGPIAEPAGSVPWSVAERAYAAYAARYGRSQSLDRLAERGGFGHSEMDWLVPGWRGSFEARP